MARGQRSATDPAQVQHAGRTVKQRRERLEGSLRAILAQPAGRFLLWALLDKAGIYETVYRPDDVEAALGMAYRAGRQDYGHALLAMIIEADEEAYLTMQREARAFERAEDRATAAVQTQAAEEREQ